MTDRLMTAQDVADLFHQPLDWFRRNVARLRRDHGFPAPIRGFRGLYDPRAIDTWLAAQRGERPSRAAVEEAAPARDWDALLDQRALNLAPPVGRA